MKPLAPGVTQPCRLGWLLAGLLVLVTVSLYWPATRCDFVNLDDDRYVTSNAQVQKGLTWEGLKWACVTPVASNWHPLTVWSHMLDCQLYGLKPCGHHLTSVLLHAVNAALVFLLLRGLTVALWPSVMVAALWAWHPVHVESVAWVAERKDVLSGLFGLLALMAYARCAQGQRQTAEGSAAWCGVRAPWLPTHLPSSIACLLCLGFFALGLLSKPMLVTLPCVMLLMDYWPLGRLDFSTLHALRSTVFRLAREKIPFFVLAAFSSVLTFLVQQRGGAVAAMATLPLDARSENAVVSYCRYLGKLVWPAELAVYYPHPGSWPPATVLLAGGLMLGLSVSLVVGWRRAPFSLMGWLWFVGMLIPVIGLVQVGEQAMADRYTYLPSVGVLVLGAWGAHELTRRWRYHTLALSVAGGAVLVLCLTLTREQLGHWKDSEALFRHALDATKDNYLAHNNLGAALDQKGQAAEAIRQFQEAIRLKPAYAEAHNNLGAALGKAGRHDEAIRQFQAALRLPPNNAEVHNNLGAALGRKGQTEEAIRQYREAVRLKPDSADFRNNLGYALAQRGQMEEAMRQYQEALRLQPDHAGAHHNYGVALARRGGLDEAASQFRQALRFKPDDAEAHYNLGVVLGQIGQTDEAIHQFQEAIRLKPEYTDAHYNLGVLLGQEGQTDEAIRQFRETVRLKPEHADAHNNLGYALANHGQIEEAIRQYQEALRLQPEHALARKNLARALARKNAPASP